jgi:AcrR family transcriptional regulator
MRDKVSDGDVRQEIFEAATACFQRLGLRRTTMDDVAEAAGVSRKTVYNYFENKNSLISEVIEREGRRVALEARDRIPLDLPPAELVVEAELALLDAGRRSPYAAMLLGPDAVTLSAEVVDHSGRIMQVQKDYWNPILERLRDAGQLRTDDLVEVVEWLTFFNFVLVARPATFEGDEQRTRQMLHRYLVPALVAV